MSPKPLNNTVEDDSMHSSDICPSKSTLATPAVVIVTPYSTGCCVALEIQKKGYDLICLWSQDFSEVMKTHVPASCKGLLVFAAELDEQATMAETAAALDKVALEQGLSIKAIVCGGEAGVDLTDSISEYMGFLSNGTDIPNRRDKKVPQELVRATGMRAVRQAGGSQFCQVQDFLELEQYPVIVKPLDSAGSDGIKLCRSFAEAEEHFHYLMEEHDMVNGGTCKEVLCQEFLKGKEYVVDHVSRDGVHKVVMVWVYDKREANGAPFVYFGDIPIDSESPEAKMVIPYVRGVLDAMGIKHGPTHAEVIITPDG
jgi:biotin carboxylase